MTPPREREEAHLTVPPCAYATALMWALGLITLLGMAVMGFEAARMKELEDAGARRQDMLVEIRTTLLYIQRDVSEVKQALNPKMGKPTE